MRRITSARSNPFTLERTDGYTGILIGDLITKGADEPYRMFTSRAEFRLHLRIDNADERLTPIGRKVGLVNDERWALFERKRRQKERLVHFLTSTRLESSKCPEIEISGDDRPTLAGWLRRPEARIGQLGAWLTAQLDEDPVHGALATVETEMKYEGYIAQQKRSIIHLQNSERRSIPMDFNYSDIPGLSNEVREKFDRVRPETLGQAGRIPGVTPAAVAVLDVYLSLDR